MFSDIVEVLGLACLVAGVFVLLGIGFALVAVCPCAFFVGAGMDDAKIAAALKRRRDRVSARVRRALGWPQRRVSAWRARPKAA